MPERWQKKHKHHDLATDHCYAILESLVALPLIQFVLSRAFPVPSAGGE